MKKIGRPTKKEQAKKRYALSAAARERYHNDPEYRAKRLAYSKKWVEEHPGRVKAKYRSDPEFRVRAIKRASKYSKKMTRQMNKLGLTRQGTRKLTKEERAVITRANIAKARKLTPQEKSKAAKDFWASQTHEEKVRLTAPAREKYYARMALIRKAKELWGPAYKEILRDLSSDAGTMKT